MKREKRKTKKKLKTSIKILLIMLALFCLVFIYARISSPLITTLILKDDTLIMKYINVFSNSKMYCNIVKNNEKIDNKKWILAKKNTCSYKLDNNIYTLYLKNNKGKIFKIEKSNELGNILSYEVSDKPIYLPIGKEYKIDFNLVSVGNIESKIKWTSLDSNIVSVDTEGVINTKAKGKTEIVLTINNDLVNIPVVSTNLIVDIPKVYDTKKQSLKCNVFSKEDNDLLDEILKYRIEQAGYKTRAGAVEAARFLTLEFPYKIDYFNENGRIAFRSNPVDGEGRYYHTGLYLHESRKENIKSKKNGPIIWGCSMYNTPKKKNMLNGLDCSGFVSWALLNAGFDVGDLGAGITDVYDLTDTGKRTTLTKKLSLSNTIKSGDLLWKNAGGGHIGMIVGIDKDNYYVAEAVWEIYPNPGVVINKYSRNTFNNSFRYVILMDDYYKEDGNLTKLWY